MSFILSQIRVEKLIMNSFINSNFSYGYLIGNKAKRVFQSGCFTGVSRKQSTPKFPKNKHFLPPDTHTPSNSTDYTFML